MSIRFCEICGNILSPGLKGKNLIYECQSCNNVSKETDNSKLNNLVYRNEIKIKQTELKIDNSIINDPSYSRSFNIPCPKCGHKEIIFFQNPNINDAGMKFFHLCCNKNYNGTGKPCNHHWIKIGIKFVVVPEDWDEDEKKTEKIIDNIYVYGFIHDKICETINKFKGQFDEKKGTIIKFEYNKKQLDPNSENTWEKIYKEEIDAYAYLKPILEDKNEN